MKNKLNHIFELTGVLIAVYLIIIIFVLVSPSVFVTDLPSAVKILVELSPYILMLGLVIGICKLQKKAVGGKSRI